MAKAMFAKVAGTWKQVFPSIPPPPVFNEATGGTVKTRLVGGVWKNIHTFTADDTLTVVHGDFDFTIEMVGGGGSGSHGTSGVTYGGGGGGGGHDVVVAKLPVGTVPVVVGKGGAAVAGNGTNGINGGSTSVGTHSVGGGEGGKADGSSGASGTPRSHPGHGRAGVVGAGGSGAGGAGVGANGGVGVMIGGTVYSGGGGGGGEPTAGVGGGAGGSGAKMDEVPGVGVRGGGGGGTRAENPHPSGAGGDGMVQVSYEVAPPVQQGFNDATGGTITTYTTVDGEEWRRHTFLASGDLTITKAPRPFKVTVIGGAGRNGEQHDGFGTSTGGGGGYLHRDELALGVGVEPVVVGASTAASSFGGLVAGQGGNGAFRSWMDACPAAGVGTPSPEGDGGTCGVGKVPAGRLAELGLPANIGQGAAGGVATNGGAFGGPGAVVVEYQIGPVPPPAGGAVNDATGGTVTEHTVGAETWRVHTFTSDGSLTVTAGPRPFRTLLVGGGGAGYTNNIDASGGGGGGQVLDRANVTLAVGQALPVVVGGPGRWNGSTGNNASASTFAGQSAAGGVNCSVSGGGGASGAGFSAGGGKIGGGGGAGGPGSGQTGGPGVASDITGASVTYGVGGSNTSTPGTPGSGGHALSFNGFAGIVVVAYRIA
jgi:hypothetical protein